MGAQICNDRSVTVLAARCRRAGTSSGGVRLPRTIQKSSISRFLRVLSMSKVRPRSRDVISTSHHVRHFLCSCRRQICPEVKSDPRGRTGRQAGRRRGGGFSFFLSSVLHPQISCRTESQRNQSMNGSTRTHKHVFMVCVCVCVLGSVRFAVIFITTLKRCSQKRGRAQLAVG